MLFVGICFIFSSMLLIARKIFTIIDCVRIIVMLNEEINSIGKNLRKVPIRYFNEKNLGDLVSTITSAATFLESEDIRGIEKISIASLTPCLQKCTSRASV